MPQGIFITLEGGEGCGKSTQLKLLTERLQACGRDVLLVHEPGGTQLGEKIRQLLLSKEQADMVPLAELFLYEASRAQIVEQVICPAVEAGKVVLCDRFYDSTVAYQGYARGLGAEMVAQLNLIATAGRTPDRTILLDLDTEAGLRRAKVATGGDGEGDRIEAAGLEFHNAVRQGFAACAAAEPQRIRVVDASGSIDEVHEAIWSELQDLLEVR